MITASRSAPILRPLCLLGADVAALVVLAPDWHRLVHDLAAPRRWIADVGPDAAVATTTAALLWLVAIWLGVGLSAAVAAVLPGRLGELGERLAGRVLPAAVVRIVAGTAGLSILVSTGTAAATSVRAAGPPAGAPTPSATAPAWPTMGGPLPIVCPSWPITAHSDGPAAAPPDSSTASPTPAPSVAASAAPATPATPAAAPEQHPNGPRSTSLTGAPAPDTTVPLDPAATPPGHVVVVAPGDSLWRIAADSLHADPSAREIAAAWPAWYVANRLVIGADPNLLRAGEVLTVPDTPDPT